MSRSSVSRPVTTPMWSSSSKILWSSSKTLSPTTSKSLLPPLTLLCSASMFPSYIPKTCSMITVRSGSTRSNSLRPIASSLAPATRSLNPSLQAKTFSTPSIVRSMPTVSLPLTKTLASSSSLIPSPSPKQTGDQVEWSPRPNPKRNTLRSNWRPRLLRSPKRVAEMVVVSPTRNCPRRGSCRPPMSALRHSNAPSVPERRSIHLSRKLQGPRARRFGHTFRIVLPKIHCHTRAPSVLTTGSQVREPGISHRRCQDSSTRKVADHHRLVENLSTLDLQESAPMGRAWSQGGVQKGSSLCTETLDAEIYRPVRRRLCDQRSSQGQTYRSIPGPCFRRRPVPLQIKGSHSSGQGQAAHRACPLQSQRSHGQSSNNLRGSSHAQVRGQQI
jgi:hypothetical protein